MAIAVRAEHLSKEYRLGTINYGMLFKDLQSWAARKMGKPDPNEKIGVTRYDDLPDRFWALKDISFDIVQGDRVGIIGRNGAGKSTLLKILSRITAPTEGRVYIKGKVASLLEVGTGFHGELTGRENIFLNGAILGMKKRQIARKLDEIIDFSGIENHIDTPVKRYSSGMYVRLAFAVAAHLESDILIADEVLAVGDAEFQKKAIGKMQELSTGNGRTVLFVSHQMSAVRSLCTKGILLKAGTITKTGDLEDVVADYMRSSPSANSSITDRAWDFADAPGSDEIKIRSVKIESATDFLTVMTPFTVRTEFWSTLDVAPINVSLHVYDMADTQIFNIMTKSIQLERGLCRAEFEFPANLMNDGTYYLDINYVFDTSRSLFFHKHCLQFEIADERERSNWHAKWPGFVRPTLIPTSIARIGDGSH